MQRRPSEALERTVARYLTVDHHPRIVQVAIDNMTAGAAAYELGPGDAISLWMVGCLGGKQTYAGTFYGTYDAEG